MSDLETVFQRIADSNYWGNTESVSGDGSTLDYTHNLRHELAKFLRMFEIGSMFDAPCGDFNWMRAVEFPANFSYLGGDIVASIVEANQGRYANLAQKFEVFDVVTGVLPEAELWFCRDCLFHLPIESILRTLRRFSQSNMTYLMTTTHLNVANFENGDVEAGGFRLLDLYRAPFHLPRDVFYRIPDYVFPYPQRELCVWSRAQVAAAFGEPG